MELMHKITGKGPLSKYNAGGGGGRSNALNIVSIIQNT